MDLPAFPPTVKSACRFFFSEHPAAISETESNAVSMYTTIFFNFLTSVNFIFLQNQKNYP